MGISSGARTVPALYGLRLNLIMTSMMIYVLMTGEFEVPKDYSEGFFSIRSPSNLLVCCAMLTMHAGKPPLMALQYLCHSGIRVLPA